MNKQERGVRNTSNFFKNRPIKGDIYSYTPIPNPEIHENGQSLLRLPIRLVDEKLDPHSVWSRVEKWLIYWESNVAKRSDPLPITDKIQIARLSSSGYSERLLAESANNNFFKFAELRDSPYGRSQIKYFKHRVTQALYAVLTEDEKEKIGLFPQERNGYVGRVDQIYKVYPQIQEIISKLSQEKDFEIIWERNPHFSDILIRLLDGENLLDVALSVGFDIDGVRHNPVLINSIDGATEAFKQMLLNARYNGRSSYTTLRRFVFAKFFNYGLDWQGKDPGKKFHEISYRLLNNPSGGKLERFIELIPALEYINMLINTSPINRSSLVLKERFPGFIIKDGKADMTTVSREKMFDYFKRFKDNKTISPGIICLVRHVAMGGSVKQVATSLKQIGFRSCQLGMEMIVGKGLLFIEQILLSNERNFNEIEDDDLRSLFKKSTKYDIGFLMKKIAQEIKQSKLIKDS